MMHESCFPTELLPHPIGIFPAGGDVLWLIGVFVPKLLGPSVLMGLADPLAGRVPVPPAEIESIDPSDRPVDDRKGKRSRDAIPAAPDEHRRVRGRRQRRSELDRRRMVVVLGPCEIAVDPLRWVREELRSSVLLPGPKSSRNELSRCLALFEALWLRTPTSVFPRPRSSP